jgi:hypothetical protein
VFGGEHGRRTEAEGLVSAPVAARLAGVAQCPLTQTG